MISQVFTIELAVALVAFGRGGRQGPALGESVVLVFEHATCPQREILADLVATLFTVGLMVICEQRIANGLAAGTVNG